MRVQSQRESRSNENPVAKEKDYARRQENRDTNLEKKRRAYLEAEVERKNYGKNRAM